MADLEWYKERCEKEDGIAYYDSFKVVDCFKEEMAMVLKIGLLCKGALPINRPSMRRVVDMLQEANPQHKVKATAKDGKSSPYCYDGTHNLH